MKTAADVVADAITEIEAQLAPLQTALAILNGRATVSGNVSVRILAGSNDPQQTEVTVHVPVNGNGNGNSNGNGASAEPPSKRTSGRLQTARILAQFDRHQVRTLEEAKAAARVSQIAVGPLLRHGYLKRKGQGLVRTAKAYTP